MQELIIIGGGPAGVAAGIYAARKQINTLLISKDFIGQAGQAGMIENWPGEKNILGPELMKKFQEHLNSYQIQTLEEKVVLIKKENCFKVKTENKEYSAKSVIIATGRKPRLLNVPGEKDFIGKGVSYCVTCDGAFFKNKKVVIIGGGNSGFEGAIELAEYAQEVFIFERGSEFKADKILQEKAKKKGIKLLNNIKIEKIKGENFVQEIEYSLNKEKKSIKTDGIFIEIGSDPVVNFLDDSLVDFSEQKEIEIDFKTCQTKTPGLFAAGDVTTVKDKQIVVACGEGVKALISVYHFLQNYN